MYCYFHILKLYKNSTGEIIDLEVDLEPFGNLLVSEIESAIGSTIIIPQDFVLNMIVTILI